VKCDGPKQTSIWAAGCGQTIWPAIELYGHHGPRASPHATAFVCACDHSAWPLVCSIVKGNKGSSTRAEISGFLPEIYRSGSPGARNVIMIHDRLLVSARGVSVKQTPRLIGGGLPCPCTYVRCLINCVASERRIRVLTQLEKNSNRFAICQASLAREYVDARIVKRGMQRVMHSSTAAGSAASRSDLIIVSSGTLVHLNRVSAAPSSSAKGRMRGAGGHMHATC
jgi:hypothetical protein